MNYIYFINILNPYSVIFILINYIHPSCHLIFLIIPFFCSQAEIPNTYYWLHIGLLPVSVNYVDAVISFQQVIVLL